MKKVENYSSSFNDFIEYANALEKPSFLALNENNEYYDRLFRVNIKILSDILMQIDYIDNDNQIEVTSYGNPEKLLPDLIRDNIDFKY